MNRTDPATVSPPTATLATSTPMAEQDNDSSLLSQLPDAQPSDSEEVARSLKLARMLWEEGQRREAVRTLQRGAAAGERAQVHVGALGPDPLGRWF